MILRKPHRVFAALWAVWGAATVVLCAYGPTFDLWVIWFGVFLMVEITGAWYDSGRRDTLSETMTWVQRHLSKHRKFARGWNAAILAFALLVSWVGVYPMGNRIEATVIGILVAVWLYDHWMSPDIHG